MSGDDEHYSECTHATVHRVENSATQWRCEACGELFVQAFRLDHCQNLLACAYQLAGLVDAPERFLDAFSQTVGYKGDMDTLLPVDLHEIGALNELQRRLDAIRALCESNEINSSAELDAQYLAGEILLLLDRAVETSVPEKPATVECPGCGKMVDDWRCWSCASSAYSE